MPLLVSSRFFAHTLPLFCLCAMITAQAVATPLSRCLGYKTNDKVLIVEATDVGMQPDIDIAAFQLVANGAIQTLLILPTGADFDTAIRQAKARELGVGVALALTNEQQDKLPWRGILPSTQVPSLYDNQGNLWRTPAELALHATEEDTRRELLAQIAKMKESGVKITHLESRAMFWRASPMLTRLYLSLAQQTGYPVVVTLGDMPLERQVGLNRNGQRAGIITPDTASSLVSSSQHQYGSRFENYDALLRSLPSGINLLAIHPAQNSAAARNTLGDLSLRVTDFAIWSQPDILKVAQQARIRFTDFSALLALQDKINADTDECLAQAINR